MSLGIKEIQTGIAARRDLVKRVIESERDFTKGGLPDRRRIETLGLGQQPYLLTDLTTESFLKLGQAFASFFNDGFRKELEESPLIQSVLKGQVEALDELEPKLLPLLGLYVLLLSSTYEHLARTNEHRFKQEQLNPFHDKATQYAIAAQHIFNKST